MNDSLFSRCRSKKIMVIIIIICCLNLILFHYYFSNHSKFFINTEKRMVNHIVLISATYFKNSTLYPPNTAIIFFLNQRNWNRNATLFCESISLTNNPTNNVTLYDTSEIKYPIEKKMKSSPLIVTVLKAAFNCPWEMHWAVCNVTSNPNALYISGEDEFAAPVAIPFRNAYEKKHDVISCLSYVYYGEKWQMILVSLETQRQYGVGLQVYYIQSIREEIFNLLKAYQKAGAVEIELWNMVNLGPDHKNLKDPNTGLERENQAGASTDCFLKYREAAEFIISWDIDEIFFPKLGKTYYEEFQQLSLKYPQAATFLYDRYTTEVFTTNSPSNFSFLLLLNTSRIIDELKLIKYVVRPSRVEGLYIHLPFNIVDGYFQQMIKENYMLHLRKWNNSENYTEVGPAAATLKVEKLFKEQLTDFLSPPSIISFDENAMTFIKTYAKKEFDSLPESVYYYPMFVECSKLMLDIYFSPKVNDSCLAHSFCKIPPISNVPCVIAHKQYTHQFVSNEIKIHFAITNDFLINNNGCNMDVYV